MTTKVIETDENGFPLIGPHVGRELELMLADQKPMAMFHTEDGMDLIYSGVGFEPYVAMGRFIKFTAPANYPAIERIWYCQPGEEWRAKLDILMFEKIADGTVWNDFSSVDLHRIAGHLLGYSKTCIEHFIEVNCRE